MNKLKASRGQVGFMQNKALALVVVGIVVGIGLQIMEQTRTAICAANSTCAADPTNTGVWTDAANATQDMASAIGNFSDWYTIIVIVIAGAVILSLLTYFQGGGRGRGTAGSKAAGGTI
jgi:hypothetical protein